jgi:hypothetical protein
MALATRHLQTREVASSSACRSASALSLRIAKDDGSAPRLPRAFALGGGDVQVELVKLAPRETAKPPRANPLCRLRIQLLDARRVRRHLVCSAVRVEEPGANRSRCSARCRSVARPNSTGVGLDEAARHARVMCCLIQTRGFRQVVISPQAVSSGPCHWIEALEAQLDVESTKAPHLESPDAVRSSLRSTSATALRMFPSYSMTLFAQWRAAMALGTLT